MHVYRRDLTIGVGDLRRRSWPEIIDRLNRDPNRVLRLKMGSPGSAQATRWRLLREWTQLEAWTVADVLFLKLKSSR